MRYPQLMNAKLSHLQRRAWRLWILFAGFSAIRHADEIIVMSRTRSDAVPRSLAQRGWYMIQEMRRDRITMKRLLSYLRYEKKEFWLDSSASYSQRGNFNRTTRCWNALSIMWLRRWGNRVSSMQGSLLYGWGYVTVNLVGAAGGYLNRLYMKTLSNRVAKRIPGRSVPSVAWSCRYGVFRPFATRKVVSRITSDTRYVQTSTWMGFPHCLVPSWCLLVCT